MAQDYRQQSIRSQCLRWRQQTCELVKQEKWDLITLNPYKDNYNCIICSNPVMSECPRYNLMNVIPFTEEIQATIERLYGPVNSDDWLLYIFESVPTISTLQYFLEKNMIDPNNGSYTWTLLKLYSIYTTNYMPIIDYILSKNGDINIQSCDGENVLLSTIICNYDLDDLIPEEQDELIRKSENQIEYLLSKGADPLLSDKNGLTALQFAYDLIGFTEQQKSRLIQLLESYA